MALVFFLTFGVIGAALSDLLDLSINALTVLTDHALTAANINEALHSLIIDGTFNGVGSDFKLPACHRHPVFLLFSSGRQRLYGKSCLCYG